MKKKSILGIVLAICMIVPSMILLSGCKDNPKTWDGTANTAWYNNTDAEFTLTTEEEFAGFAQLVNEGNTFENKTIKLSRDMDMKGHTWTPIGNFSATHVVGQPPESAFKGTFDGQNKTVSNVTATKYAISETEGTYFACGLFGVISYNAFVKNVVISNSSFEGNHYVGALVGYVRSATVENVQVKNSSVNCIYANSDASGDKAGALLGYADASSLIKNSSAKTCKVQADRDAGQLIGCVQGNQVTVDTDCTVEDVAVTCNESGKDVQGSKSGQNINNELVGRHA